MTRLYNETFCINDCILKDQYKHIAINVKLQVYL